MFEPRAGRIRTINRGDMKSSSFPKLSILAGVTAGLVHGVVAQAQDLRKDATDATKQANLALLKQLPFGDTSDFDAANKGFIVPLPSETTSSSWRMES